MTPQLFTPIDPVRFAARLFPRSHSRPFTDWMEPTRPRTDVKERAYGWPNLTQKDPLPNTVDPFKQGPTMRFHGWPNLTHKELLP
jgi:hypothetical protein